MISISILETLIFLFNFISHLILFTLNILYDKSTLTIVCNKNLNINNYNKLLFLIGHILISFVMLFRIGINLSGTIIVSLVGSIGHFSLFLSMLFSIINLYKISLLDIIFMIGQIGMIYTYCIEHIVENESLMNINDKIFILATFIIMSFYYFYSFNKTKTIIRYGKLLIFLVYLFLIILFYLHNEKYNYIRIF